MRNQYNYDDDNQFEKNIVDIDILKTDVKINPDFYIHTALINAQQAVLKDDINKGFMQFRILIEYMESVAFAAGVINTTYDEEIKKFTASEDYSKQSELVKTAKIANKKMLLILKELFSTRTKNTPLNTEE